MFQLISENINFHCTDDFQINHFYCIWRIESFEGTKASLMGYPWHCKFSNQIQMATFSIQSEYIKCNSILYLKSMRWCVYSVP